jgi:hypothetical protein
MKLIPLANGGFTIVDAADYDDLVQYRWLLSRNGKRFYVRRFEKVSTPEGSKQKCIYMHRQIMTPPDGMDVDHRFGDGLDNRRENLRICTRVQNSQNSRKRATSKHKGVFKTHNNKYAARIYLNGAKTHIGVYEHSEAAARAYDQKVKELFGEFANLNFPNE